MSLLLTIGNVTGAVQLLRRHQTTAQLAVITTNTTTNPTTTATANVGQDKKRILSNRRILS